MLLLLLLLLLLVLARCAVCRVGIVVSRIVRGGTAVVLVLVLLRRLLAIVVLAVLRMCHRRDCRAWDLPPDAATGRKKKATSRWCGSAVDEVLVLVLVQEMA
jgi:hypothetical protein